MTHDLDVTFKETGTSSPLVVFIHGLGMDKNIWVDPTKSRILAGNAPVTVLLGRKPRAKRCGTGSVPARKFSLGEPPRTLPSLFDAVLRNAFPALAWSQHRPVASALHALDELHALMDRFRNHARRGIILVGHSRGGLIARRYAIENPERVRAVISIGTPYAGSTLARWADLLAKTARILPPLAPNHDSSSVKTTIKRVNDFIRSTAVTEILPGSSFLASLQNNLKSTTFSLCIAGTNPNFFSIYKWNKICIKNSKSSTLTYYMKPKVLFEFPGSLGIIAPEELRNGKGDGLVARSSAIAGDCTEAATFPLNHVQLLFAHAVHRKILSFLDTAIQRP